MIVIRKYKVLTKPTKKQLIYCYTGCFLSY